MQEPAALAVAAAVAAVVEATALNPLTLLRNRRQAGYRGRTQWRWAWRRGWRVGLGLQLASLLVRRAFSFGAVAWLGQRGIGPTPAGFVVGALEGLALSPTRRIYFLQQTAGEHVARQNPSTAWLARLIVAREGWRGLWRGGLLNCARAGLGGAVYFGVLYGAWRVCPGCWAVVPGALATAACTIAMNPMEVILARHYRVRSIHSRKPGRLTHRGKRLPWRGLRLALWRAVPAAAANYWLLHTVARLLCDKRGGQ